MTNIKLKSKAEYLLVAAVALTLVACSGGKKSGTASVEVTDNVVLDLPEDRALADKELKKSNGSMFEVGTNENGSDVKAEKNSSMGSELMARLNILSAKTDGVDEVNAQLEEFVSGLLKRDLEVAKATFAKAEQEAIARKEGRQTEVTNKYGGATAVQTLTEMVSGVNILKERRAKVANELVAAINSIDDRSKMLFAAKKNRANEIADIEGAIKSLEQKIVAVKEGRAATLEGQKEGLALEVEILNERIKSLELQVSVVESDFRKAFQARRDQFADWQVPGLGWQLRGKSDETIRREVIDSDPGLKVSESLAANLKARLEEAKAKKDAKQKQMKSTDISKVAAPAELKSELDRLTALRNSYGGVTHRTQSYGYMYSQPYSYTTKELYLVEGKFMSEEDLSNEIVATLQRRSATLEELRAMDPKKINDPDSSLKGKALLASAATRSAEYYRDIITKAFDKELKEFSQLQVDRNEVDNKFGQEVQSAAAELQKTENYLKEYSSRISGGLKSVSACQELVLADKESSNRTLVDSISADLQRNLVTSLVSFQDYHKEETQSEFDADKNIAYTNSKDFGRFIYLMLNEKNEVIGFKTVSGIKPTVKKVLGTGTTNIEYRDPNDGEKPTFLKGEMEYSVNEFKTSFATPVSDIEGKAVTVALCVQKNDGKLEYKTRNVRVNRVPTPVAPTQAE